MTRSAAPPGPRIATCEVAGGDPATPTGREIARLGPWFHNVHLPDGTQTAPTHPLGDFPRTKWQALAPSVPQDLAGWRALDVGCNGGFYTVELARRGARVTALEVEPRYLAQARFVVAQFGLGERVELRRGSVYALARSEERYDLVWFTGVLYHLRHPLLALDALAEVTRRLLVVQSLTLGDPATPGTGPAAPPAVPEDLDFTARPRLAEPGWPHMAFVEHRFAGDPTNWWVPDAACLEAMVRSSGFRILARPAPETLVCAPRRHDPGRPARRRELAEASKGAPEPPAA